MLQRHMLITKKGSLKKIKRFNKLSSPLKQLWKLWTRINAWFHRCYENINEALAKKYFFLFKRQSSKNLKSWRTICHVSSKDFLIPSIWVQVCMLFENMSEYENRIKFEYENITEALAKKCFFLFKRQSSGNLKSWRTNKCILTCII